MYYPLLWRKTWTFPLCHNIKSVREELIEFSIYIYKYIYIYIILYIIYYILYIYIYNYKARFSKGKKNKGAQPSG